MWYKFEAIHGGGHQSKSVDYKWFDPLLDADDREFEWENWIMENFWGDAVGEVVLVIKLPSKVREAKKNHYHGVISDAEKMLALLMEEGIE